MLSRWRRLAAPHRAALLVAAISLAIRLAWACFAHVTPISDFDGYDRLARHWLEHGNFPGAYRTPGYPGFLAIVYAICGHSWRAVQIAQAFVGALTSGLIVLLASRIVRPRTAAIAGALHATSLTSIAYVGLLASETLAVACVVAVVLVVTTEADSRRPAITAAAGVLFGLALLVRPAMLFLLPAIGLLALWEPRAARWRLLPAVTFAIAALITIAPWQIRNARQGLGVTTISTAGGNDLWMGNRDGATTGGFAADEPGTADGFPTQEPARDRALRNAALEWMAAHPSRYLTLSAIRARRMWGLEPDGWAARFLWPTAENDAVLRAVADDDLPAADRDAAKRDAHDMLAPRRNTLRAIRVVFAPLFLVALVASLRRRRAFAAVLLPIASYAVLLSLTFFQARFREVSDALLVIPLAALLSDLACGTDELGWPRRVLQIAAGVSILLAVLVSL